MTPPETLARQALISMLEAEFAAEGYPVKDDKLHGSVGAWGPVIAVYPDRSMTSGANAFVNEMRLVVQFYDAFERKVDPNQEVSPSIIEGYADRFRNALRTRNPDPNVGAAWYFMLDQIVFPPDPTGNITRFEAHLTVRGNNGALITETGA